MTFFVRLLPNMTRVRGVEIDEDEIFVSDGAKSDCGRLEIYSS